MKLVTISADDMAQYEELVSWEMASINYTLERLAKKELRLNREGGDVAVIHKQMMGCLERLGMFGIFLEGVESGQDYTMLEATFNKIMANWG